MLNRFGNIFDNEKSALQRRAQERDVKRDAIESQTFMDLKQAALHVRDKIQTGNMSFGVFTESQLTETSSVKVKAKQPITVAKKDFINLQKSVDLSNPNTCYGLRYRCFAVESLLFIVETLKECENRIKSALPLSEHSKVGIFLKMAENLVDDLRLYIFRHLAIKCLNFDSVYISV